MGWGFRKSVKFGPMHVNFSKSGIGVSASVKGARVSVGPRGTHLNLGRGPFFYHQKLGGSGRAKGGGAVNLPPPGVVAEALPPDSPYQRPAFPKHGLPRIVPTLGLIALAAIIIGAIVSSNSSSVPTSGSPGSSAPALQTVPAPSKAVPSPAPRTSSRKSRKGSIAQPARPATALPDEAGGESGQAAAAPIRTAPSTSQSGLIRGPRGGCYYISGSGRKVYVDRSQCN